MAEYNPSKIIKDGNTYNFRDNTKIPLVGSNQISGSLIPSTDGTVDLGGPSYQWNNAYIKSYYYNGTQWGLDQVNTWTAHQKVVGDNSRGLVSIYNPAYTKGSALSVTELALGTIFMGNGGQEGLANSLGFVSTDLASSGARTLLSLSAMENTASSSARTNVTIQYDKNDAVDPRKVTIQGSIFPHADATYSLGTSTNKWKNVNTVLLNGKTPAYNDDVIPRSGGAVLTGETLGRNVDDNNLRILGGSAWNTGAQLQLCGKNMSGGFGGTFTLYANTGDSICSLQGTPSGALTWNRKNLAMQEDTVPRSGGAVLTNYFLGKSEDTGSLMISGGTSWSSGGSLETFGSSHSSYAGQVRLQPALSDSNFKTMNLEPSGTWSWSGTACQITSDQRLKQQITQIDDKLLDAWGDVELSQFKYNDAVDQKKDKARLHTGYVVQQIDSACKSHGVDISQYGLFCHEEYPQETEEIEVEQADGTKVKETKVIREASEHYSLRYTEALIVECKYLRRCIARLTARIEQLEGVQSK